MPNGTEQVVQDQQRYYLNNSYENLQNIKMEPVNFWSQNVYPQQMEKTTSSFNQEKLERRLNHTFINQENHNSDSIFTPEMNLSNYHQTISNTSVELKQDYYYNQSLGQDTGLNHGTSHFNHGLNHMDPSVIQYADHDSDDLNQLSAEPSNYSLAKSFVTDQPMNHVTPQLANHLPNQHPAPLYKQNINNIKQNKTNTFAENAARASTIVDQNFNTKSNKPDAILFYQQNFGTAGPFVMETLLDYIKDLGDELVIEAMKRALERNKVSWRYVKSILNSWYKKGIRTLDQAYAEQINYKNNHKQRQGESVGNFGYKNEVVPDWFYEQKKNRTEREQKAKKKKATFEDLEKVKQEYLQGRKNIRKVV